MLGMADSGVIVGPGFFFGGLVVRLPLADALEVSSSKLATCAYTHSVCLLMHARQFGRPRSHYLTLVLFSKVNARLIYEDVW